jgi:hypothetical protein
MQAEVETSALAILPVQVPNAMRPIGITTRVDWEPTQAQRDFLDLLRSTAEATSGQGPMHDDF